MRRVNCTATDCCCVTLDAVREGAPADCTLERSRESYRRDVPTWSQLVGQEFELDASV